MNENIARYNINITRLAIIEKGKCVKMNENDEYEQKIWNYFINKVHVAHL